MSFLESSELEDAPLITPAVKVLISLCVAVLFLQWTVVNDADMFSALAFQWSALDRRWWTVATYMFVHAGLLHLAFNMYALFLFGPRLEHAWSTKRFVRFYIFCGIAGLICHALFTRDGMLLGASAAVFGVMVAFAMTWPDQEILLFAMIPVRVWTLVALLVGLNLALGMWALGSGGGGVAYFAHLGGALAGWFYLRTPGALNLDHFRGKVAQVPDSPDEPPRAIPRSQPRTRERSEVDEIVAKSKAALSKRPAAAVPAPPPRKDELDRVLDKISAQGLESLTKEERAILEQRSKELRRDD